MQFYKYNIALVGDHGVGKTSLLKRLMKNNCSTYNLCNNCKECKDCIQCKEYIESSCPTENIVSFTIHSTSQTVTFNVCELTTIPTFVTGGSNHCLKYMQNIDAAIILFYCGDCVTGATTWYKALRSLRIDIPIVFVGSKWDWKGCPNFLSFNNPTSKNKEFVYTLDKNSAYFGVSAKDNHCVEKPFLHLISNLTKDRDLCINYNPSFYLLNNFKIIVLGKNSSEFISKIIDGADFLIKNCLDGVQITTVLFSSNYGYIIFNFHQLLDPNKIEEGDFYKNIDCGIIYCESSDSNNEILTKICFLNKKMALFNSDVQLKLLNENTVGEFLSVIKTLTKKADLQLSQTKDSELLNVVNHIYKTKKQISEESIESFKSIIEIKKQVLEYKKQAKFHNLKLDNRNKAIDQLTLLKKVLKSNFTQKEF